MHVLTLLLELITVFTLNSLFRNWVNLGAIVITHQVGSDPLRTFTGSYATNQDAPVDADEKRKTMF